MARYLRVCADLRGDLAGGEDLRQRQHPGLGLEGGAHAHRPAPLLDLLGQELRQGVELLGAQQGEEVLVLEQRPERADDEQQPLLVELGLLDHQLLPAHLVLVGLDQRLRRARPIAAADHPVKALAEGLAAGDDLAGDVQAIAAQGAALVGFRQLPSQASGRGGRSDRASLEFLPIGFGAHDCLLAGRSCARLRAARAYHKGNAGEFDWVRPSEAQQLLMPIPAFEDFRRGRE